MIKVSVIVPVYNTVKYLDKCIKSIVNQTFKDFEIILIDDGSTDGSRDKIKYYSKKYSFINSFFQTNKGRNKTRNIGMGYSMGKYICFVDSDDYIEKDYLEKLYNKISSNNYDMVISNYYTVKSKRKKIRLGISEDLFNKETIKPYIPRLNNMLWNKMYRGTLIRKLEFNENVFFEDIDFLYRLFPHINRLGIVKESLYNYNIREDSATNVFDNRWYDLENSLNYIVNYYKDNNLYVDYKTELEYIYVRYMYTTFIKNIARGGDYNKLMEAFNYAKEAIRKAFPHYKGNKYLKNITFKNIYLKYFNRIFVWIVYINVKLRYKSN